MRIVGFVTSIVLAAFLTPTVFAQVPPGVAYNPKKHPNPVVTYIQNKDFKPTTYIQAKMLAGFDPLGLSGKEGKRTSIEIAVPNPTVRKIAFPDNEFQEVKVEFYPVVRQSYKLNGSGELVLDAFRFPKVPIPLNDLTGVLNTAAFLPGDKYWKPRFGPAATPEIITVRGVAALLFDDNNEFNLFWREGAECYVARTRASRSDLIRMVEDLL